MAAVTSGFEIDTKKYSLSNLDWRLAELQAYTAHAPQTFQKILDDWNLLGKTLLFGTNYDPNPSDRRERLEEHDIFAACTKFPGAMSCYLSQERHFYLCLKLFEETSNNVYTLRFVDDNYKNSGLYSAHKTFKMELWDADEKRCDKTLSGMRWYDCEMSGALNLERLLKGEAVVFSSSFYNPEKGSHSFSLANSSFVYSTSSR